MKEVGAEVWGVINAGGNVYICGDAKHMAKDVEQTLVEIMVTHGGMSASRAQEQLVKMEKTEKFLKDVWSV